MRGDSRITQISQNCPRKAESSLQICKIKSLLSQLPFRRKHSQQNPSPLNGKHFKLKFIRPLFFLKSKSLYSTRFQLFCPSCISFCFSNVAFALVNRRYVFTDGQSAFPFALLDDPPHSCLYSCHNLTIRLKCTCYLFTSIVPKSTTLPGDTSNTGVTILVPTSNAHSMRTGLIISIKNVPESSISEFIS